MYNTYIHDFVQDSEGGMQPKNFTNYLLYINIYMITLIMTYFFFFNTDYKRSKVKVLILT